MLSESFIVATESVKPPAAHLSSQLKDVGIFIHELQPQVKIQQGFKKSSVSKNCIACSNTHIFAAQAGKAVINVYSREKGNQEATVPFPHKVTSLAFADRSAILVIGTQDGMLTLWEIATGRVINSTPSHVEAVTHLVVSPDGAHIVSGSSDTTVHVWSIPLLVSFERPNELGSSANNEPIATWTQHRTGITALAVGHSKSAATNFVVSASDDKTCYIWSLDGLQLLGTYILADSPQCAVLDSADRAVYFGSDNGCIQHIDLLSSRAKSKRSLLSTTPQEASTPIQLKLSAQWQPPSDTIAGSAQCITLSYDSMTMLSGHASGKVLRWEVAKHRMVGELPPLTGQSVTNITMLSPVGFAAQKEHNVFNVPSIVKPRLDLNGASNIDASSAIPGDYNINIQVHHARNRDLPKDLDMAFDSPDLPQSLIDDAVQALTRDAVSNMNGKSVQNNDTLRVSQLEEELSTLRSQLKQNENQNHERLKRHQARMDRRQNIGQERRDAFFIAKKAGRNGDDAMKPFSKLEQDIDNESDEDAVSEAQRDVQMAG